MKYETLYEVRRYEHGYGIVGAVPLNHFAALGELFQREGCPLLDPGIGEALGLNFFATSKKKSQACRAAIEAENLKKYDHPLDRWWHGLDTDISSKTLLVGVTGPMWGYWTESDAGVPCDADGFGRCIRLLDLAPTLRERLPAAAERFPAWEPFIRKWDALEAAYREALSAHEAGKPRAFDALNTILDALNIAGEAIEDETLDAMTGGRP